jgi:5-carboxymethyl-2-hydroxymuconate isomerase
MPHTIVEYSAAVADAFDRPAFGKDLHDVLVRAAGAKADGCKTRFVRLDDTFIADGSPHYALVHAEISLLAGRTPEVKREVTEAALDLLRRHIAPLPHLEVQFSVDLRDLDRDAYVRHEEPRTQA